MPAALRPHPGRPCRPPGAHCRLELLLQRLQLPRHRVPRTGRAPAPSETGRTRGLRGLRGAGPQHRVLQRETHVRAAPDQATHGPGPATSWAAPAPWSAQCSGGPWPPPELAVRGPLDPWQEPGHSTAGPPTPHTLVAMVQTREGGRREEGTEGWRRDGGRGGDRRGSQVLTIHCQKTSSRRRHSRAASRRAFSLSSLRSSCSTKRGRVRAPGPHHPAA